MQTKPALRVLNTNVLQHVADHCLTLQEVLTTVEAAHLGLGEGANANPPKLSVQAPDQRSIAYAMLGRDGRSQTVGIKTSFRHVAVDSPRAVRYHTSLLLHDDRTGEPLALLDAARVGSLRTPATSALLARACAHPEARSALVIGCGVQGRMALPFLLLTLPHLERLMVHGRHPDGLRQVASELKRHHPGRQVEVRADLEQAAAEADILIGAAGPASPARVAFAHLRSGSACILVGHGLHADTLHQADHRVATHAGQMQATGADLALQGHLPPPHAELHQILLGRQSGRPRPEDRVFAYNSGLVVTDIALGRLLAERAQALGLGEELALW